MKIFKRLITLALLWPALSLAALNLAEPDALLKKAAQSRSSLLDVILAVEFNIPEMRDPATFDKYFAMMDELQGLATKSGLEEYYPDIVKKLGLNMTANGMRWLDVTQAPTEKVSYYVKWMDADTLARFLGLIEYQTSIVKDPVRLKRMSENIEAILPAVDQKAASLPYVQLGFRRLTSDAAVALLKTETMNPQEVDFWIKKIKIASSFSEYLDHLNQGIYSLERSNRSFGHIYITRLSLLMTQSAKMSEVAPNWLLNGIGDSLSEVLLRMVRLEERFAKDEFSAALGQLKPRHLQGIAQQWMAQDKLPQQDYVEHYLGLARTLITHLEAANLRKEANELQRYLAKAAAPVMAQKLAIEGHYKLKNAQGDVWYFTIAVSRENTLVAALSDDKSLIYKTFFNVAYNLKKDGFVASEREPDVDGDQNPPVEFKIDGEKISLVDPFVRSGLKTLQGVKVQAFTNPWDFANPDAPSANGTYEGTLFLPSGSKMEARLIVTSFNGYSLGRIDSGNISIELNLGTEGNDGVIILTSARKVGASWFQLRGNVVEGGLNVYVVVGGKGQGVACSFLKRVE